MIAAIAAAVASAFSDPLDSPDHATRTAAHAARVAELKAATEKRVQAAAVSERNAMQLDRLELAEIESKAKAARVRLNAEISKSLRAELSPLVLDFMAEPTRAAAIKIGSCIHEHDSRVQAQLDAELSDRSLYLALIDPYVQMHPSLATTVHLDPHGAQVQRAYALRSAATPKAAAGINAIAVYTGLLDLEHHVSELVAHAPIAPPHFEAVAELARLHSVCTRIDSIT